MIFFDVTKSAHARHQSGLMRLNRRLRDELGHAIEPVAWGKWNPASARPNDWYFTTEVFDVAKRQGFARFLQQPTCQLAAIFPDAIPVKFPEITWPHAVARHPTYMQALSRFDHVFAISREVQQDLLGFWQWQENPSKTVVTVLPLGADFDGTPRVSSSITSRERVLVCVGIVEPRKNQSFLLDVVDELWNRQLQFELHILGRINPFHGPPIVAKIRHMQSRHSDLHFHEAASDDVFARILNRARAVVVPTLTEGCGLPVLESLWRGLPCVCSDLPVLRENAAAGGCLLLPVNDRSSWGDGLSRLLTDEECWQRLSQAAATRRLPTWADSARVVRQILV